MRAVELEQRVAELFKAALDVAPAQQAAFLQRECGSDETLRAAVEALLAADTAATGFLEPRWGQPRGIPSPTSAGVGPAMTGPPPDSFVGYQILKEVHRGGQGVVYEALQKSTRRNVAIKVMREGPFSAGSIIRTSWRSTTAAPQRAAPSS
jgi:hypothetical protein